MLPKVVQLFIIALFLHDASCLKNCGDDELEYTYTECDKQGDRWRVAVPKNPETCEITKPKPLVKGMNCNTACKSGEYLNSETQTCDKCPKGTYSLGSGVRFDSWESMPQGFKVSSESVSFEEYGYHSKVGNCSTSVWTASKDSIRSNTDDCTSSLSYAVVLKVAGKVSFEYQYSDEDVIFHFYVRDAQCQVFHDKFRNVFLNTTKTKWGLFTADLNAGENILFWKTTGILVGGRETVQPVRIRSIEISGVSYSTNCIECREGYFNDKLGQRTCDPCPANTHSGFGATKCSKCDTSTEYSPAMSPTCLPRQPCKDTDYFETHSACNENNKYSLSYKWIDPKICKDNLAGSVSLPVSNTLKECAPCNPGYQPSATSVGECTKCEQNMYSDGKQSCASCPANTSPNYGYYYLSWDRLPENVQVSCLTAVDGGCSRDKKGWVPIGNAMQTAQGQNVNAYLLLMLKASAYGAAIFNQGGKDVFGKISFVFETDCSEECQLFFMKEIPSTGTVMLESWQGTQARQTYSYQITENEEVTYTWAFQKTSDSEDDIVHSVALDSATIFLVNITNTVDGVADSCKTCAQENKNSKCIACSKGHFVDEKTSKCLECDEGYILKQGSQDVSKCTKCNEGTTSNQDHTACEQTCSYESPLTHRKYNFSGMSAPVLAATLPLFTETGNKYYHSYNFSLCGNNGFGIADCAENVSLAKHGFADGTVGKHSIGMICRSTQSFTEIGGRLVSIHTKPVLIASEMYNVTHTIEANEDFPKEPTNEKDDVVYYMKNSNLESKECPDGGLIAIHLRCDPKISDIEVTMPAKCPDGTCDGCNFHFLWRSAEACPICTNEDYISIQGACENGQLTTNYVWKTYPKNCKDGVDLPDDEILKCTPVKFYVEIGLFVGFIVVIILMLLLCKFWKRSKKLEYKYHRLMTAGNKGGGELPAADSCAISGSESDDENDEVMFKKKRSAILGNKKSINNYDSVSLKPLTQGV